MRKLIHFFWKYHDFLLFVLLELIAFLMLINYNTHQRIAALSWTNEITGRIYGATSRIEELARLRSENKRLAFENASLREQVLSSYLKKNRAVYPFIDSNYYKAYSFIPAQVIDNSLSGQHNFLMLDQGRKSGIEAGMGVVNLNGVVGIVTDVTPHYSIVMSVINTNFSLGVRLKNSDYFGILSWNGNDPDIVQIDDIPGFVPVSNGDTVITLGASGIFPPGLVTATVVSASENPETGFLEINARLTSSLRSSSYVYVVKHLLKDEVDTLNPETSEQP